ncbi:hypothetical protein [Desertivirga arenae]|uniref:hypothetical protein n=1 Tax=Desertivirga arenae TaxID=2810309 RepID=UPI001A97B7F7|nr:hypothetical protein [Pedobacter sp. SYSU D00823]
MTKDELLTEIKQTLEKVKVEKLAAIAGRSDSKFNDLIDLSFHKDKAIAFRASWILETAANLHPDKFWDSAGFFLDRYTGQSNNSCRRHFTKILMWMLHKKTQKIGLGNFDWSPVIESTFEWLTDPECPVAVKVNCLDILLALKDQEDWIAEELRAETEFLLKDGSAAMQSRGKKVLRKLTASSSKRITSHRRLLSE